MFFSRKFGTSLACFFSLARVPSDCFSFSHVVFFSSFFSVRSFLVVTFRSFFPFACCTRFFFFLFFSIQISYIRFSPFFISLHFFQFVFFIIHRFFCGFSIAHVLRILDFLSTRFIFSCHWAEPQHSPTSICPTTSICLFPFPIDYKNRFSLSPLSFLP